MSPKLHLKRCRTRTEPRSRIEDSQLRAGGILNKESVEQTTFQSIDAASPVPPHAPGVRLFLAGRRGVATGHPPGAGNYTGKPGGAAGVRKHFSPLSRPGTRPTRIPLRYDFRYVFGYFSWLISTYTYTPATSGIMWLEYGHMTPSC